MTFSTVNSFKVQPLTCALGAELVGLRLGDAANDEALFGEIRRLLLVHKVLFQIGRASCRERV